MRFLLRICTSAAHMRKLLKQDLYAGTLPSVHHRPHPLDDRTPQLFRQEMKSSKTHFLLYALVLQIMP